MFHVLILGFLKICFECCYTVEISFQILVGSLRLAICLGVAITEETHRCTKSLTEGWRVRFSGSMFAEFILL